MTSYEWIDKLWNIFAEDDELCALLEIDKNNEASYALKLRTEDFLPEEYSPDGLDFIAIYFADAMTTYNDYMNKGILRIDIYSSLRDNVPPIRKRIVELIHKHFDERVRGEGQYASGIVNVYKYRVEFTPLIFT